MGLSLPVRIFVVGSLLGKYHISPSGPLVFKIATKRTRASHIGYWCTAHVRHRCPWGLSILAVGLRLNFRLTCRRLGIAKEWESLACRLALYGLSVLLKASTLMFSWCRNILTSLAGGCSGFYTRRRFAGATRSHAACRCRNIQALLYLALGQLSIAFVYPLMLFECDWGDARAIVPPSGISYGSAFLFSPCDILLFFVGIAVSFTGFDRFATGENKLVTVLFQFDMSRGRYQPDIDSNEGRWTTGFRFVGGEINYYLARTRCDAIEALGDEKTVGWK